jgi:hypothetical protein
MTTPMEQKELVVKYGKKKDFETAFIKKYSATMSTSAIMSRTKSLWECRKRHAEEVRVYNENLEKKRLEQIAKDRTVLIPKQIVNKVLPAPENGSRNSLPDVGELLIKQNNLIAEMIALQKEQISRTNESIGLARSQLDFLKSIPQKKVFETP